MNLKWEKINLRVYGGFFKIKKINKLNIFGFKYRDFGIQNYGTLNKILIEFKILLEGNLEEIE